MQDDRYAIRLAILTALHRAGRRPMTTQDIMRSLAIEEAGIAPLEVREHLPGLVDNGYVENVCPGQTPLWRLTTAGRNQITRDAPLEQYIYGADAFINR